MRPFLLPPNVLPRFYRGGPRLASFRGVPPGEIAGPEDWVGSATAAHGEADLGRTALEDGRLLADAVAADPEGFLGPAHADAHGGDPRLLVKLLDAGERLAVHFHPDDAFSRAHLSSRYGKTEAWVILDAEPGAEVRVGYAREIASAELAEWVAVQDVEAMIAAMRRLPVAAGDSIFVPAGVPHVIGEGILLLELQQPSDLSLMLEWKGVVPEASAFLGLPVELALSAVRRSALDDGELARLTSRRGAALFPTEADAFFRADRLVGGAEVEPAFAILVGVTGAGELVPEDGVPIPVRRGSTVLVPYAAGACRLEGGVEAIRARPPAVSGG